MKRYYANMEHEIGKLRVKDLRKMDKDKLVDVCCAGIACAHKLAEIRTMVKNNLELSVIALNEAGNYPPLVKSTLASLRGAIANIEDTDEETPSPKRKK